MDKDNGDNSEIKESKLKECFANQAGMMLGGDPPDECADKLGTLLRKYLKHLNKDSYFNL